MAPSAFDRALKLLERRPHFRREVEQKLARAGFASDEIAGAVERLAGLGYLDDATHAKGFATSLAARKGFGAARIRRELARRGASRDAVAGALEGRSDDDLTRARLAAEKWARRGARDAAALARHLDRRGFDRHVIFTVLKELAPSGASESSAEE